MKIWFEALTGKQALLFHHLALKLEKNGHNTFFTSRPYSIDRANSNLDRLGRKHKSIGKYGNNLKEQLIEGSKRIIELTEYVYEEQPDLMIAFPSPDAFRTAFGLKIPSLQINDTPHATAVAKLTISLSNGLIHSDAIKSEDFAKNGVTKFFPYSGVDEIEWIKFAKPDENVIKRLDLEKENFIVLRCEESKATYFRNLYPNRIPGQTYMKELIEKLRKKGLKYKFVVFPRYPEQEEILEDMDVIIPESSVDGISLTYFSKLTITGGGTMGREAALLGTPTIYSFPMELAVSKFITELGFPLFHFPNINELPKKIINLLEYKRIDENERKLKIEKLESPFDGIKRALKELDL